MGVVNEAIQNTVGQRRIADLLVPLGDGQLAGEDRRAHLVAVLADFQEVPLALPERRMQPIVHDQHIDAGQPGQLVSQAAVGAGQSQFAKQFGDADEESGETIPASLLRPVARSGCRCAKPCCSG